MPTFNFTAATKIKKSSGIKTNKSNSYRVIEKDVYCVCGIDIEGNYYAHDIINNVDYKFTSRSYTLKTKSVYSQQLIKGKRLQVIELTDKEIKAPWLFLPFAPGVGLYGKLVKNVLLNAEHILFDLDRTFDIPKDNENYVPYFIFYRENYNIIYPKLLEKYGKSI